MSSSGSNAEKVRKGSGLEGDTVRRGLYLLVGLLAGPGVMLLFHRSLEPYVLSYSRTYLVFLSGYFSGLFAIVLVARFAVRPVARLLGVPLAQHIILAGSGMIVCFLLLEGISALLPAHLLGLYRARADRSLTFRDDPLVHHLRRAGARGVVVSINGEFRVDVQINSDSLRDIEHPIEKPPGVLRIFLLGDSFVEALQVSLAETFAKQLEGLLTRETGHPVEVINGGIGGASPLTEYLLLKHKGLKYRPDLVLVAFFMNDVADDAYHARSISLDPIGVPIGNSVQRSFLEELLQTMNHKSRVVWVLTSGYLQLTGRSRLSPLLYSIFEDHYTATENEAWAGTTQVLKAIRDLATAHRTRYGLVAIPWPSQVNSVQGKPPCRVARGMEITATSTRPQQILAQFTQENQIPFLDLLPALRAVKEAPVFFAYDCHFSPAGHKVAARAIADFVLAHDLLGQGQRAGLAGRAQ